MVSETARLLEKNYRNKMKVAFQSSLRKTINEMRLQKIIQHYKQDFILIDWEIEKPSLRGEFIKWIAKGDVNRPLYEYTENKIDNFVLNNSLKSGEMFVAIGTKKSSQKVTLYNKSQPPIGRLRLLYQCCS